MAVATIRQQREAGHKAFVDYSGKLTPITDPVADAVSTAEIFAAVLVASSLTYARRPGRRSCRT